MSEPIVSIASIERKARKAAEVTGGKFAVCPFPPASAAAKTWRIAHRARVEELTCFAGQPQKDVAFATFSVSQSCENNR